jgi:hypothetical protein
MAVLAAFCELSVNQPGHQTKPPECYFGMRDNPIDIWTGPALFGELSLDPDLLPGK